eukprot:GAHX01001855.1.p1 GENE.GAHX01001855.1~~GAHX01001855.1.p1  ORF type:complete len:252 (-),score=42.58 GAHX01001855.1:51-767(-)
MLILEKIQGFINNIPIAFYVVVISLVCGLLSYPIYTLTLMEFFDKMWPSLLSFFFTVAVVERLQKIKEGKEEEELLLKKLKSREHRTAINALEELRVLGLCEAPNSILKGEVFLYANWESANLYKCDLSFADLSRVNLLEADLVGANLKGAILVGFEKNERNSMSRLEIKEAVIEKLSGVKTMHGCILPNGKLYNGYFDLEEDLQYAKRSGIDVNNDKAMARWYGVGLEDYKVKEYFY